MGGLQFLGVCTRKLVLRFVISRKCDLRKCRESGEGTRSLIEPWEALFREERASRRQVPGAFEGANMEVRFVLQLRIAAGERGAASGAEAALHSRVCNDNFRDRSATIGVTGAPFSLRV